MDNDITTNIEPGMLGEPFDSMLQEYIDTRTNGDRWKAYEIGKNFLNTCCHLKRPGLFNWFERFANDSSRWG